jgi:Glycosyltransferase family 87
MYPPHTIAAGPSTERSGLLVIRLAWVVWVLLGLATCGRALLVPYSDRHAGIYPVFAHAGQAWYLGHPVYAREDGFHVFRYSPLMAALLAPFGLMPDVVGNLAWRLLNFIAFLAGLKAWVRRVLPRDLTAQQRGGIYLLAALLAGTGLVDGQSNALVIGLLLLASADVARQRWWWSAGCVALACLLKLFPVAFALLVMAVYFHPFTWRVLLTIAAGLAFPFFLQSPDYVFDQYPAWFSLVVRDSGRQDWPLDLAYRDLRFLFRVYLAPLTPSQYLAIQLGVAAGMAGLCVAAQRQRWSCGRLMVLLLGLSVTWMLVLGPSTEGVTYILMAPTLAWAVVESWIKRTRRLLPTLALALVVGASVAVWFPNGKKLHLLGPHPLAGLLLMIHLVVGAVRQLRALSAGRTPLASAHGSHRAIPDSVPAA